MFPQTRVAAVEHRGPAAAEYDAVRRLVSWKLEHRFLDHGKYRTYGLHYADPRSVSPAEYRAEFCLSIDEQVGENAHGVYEKLLLACRCARARDVGSRKDNRAVKYLFDVWLPASGERWNGTPAIFHYVNVGPSVKESEAITDVYLPLA